MVHTTAQVETFRQKRCRVGLAMQMKDGRYRLLVFNDDLHRYIGAEVTAPKAIKRIDVVSKYPVLPPKRIGADTFIGRVTPGGLSIFDVWLDGE